VPVSVDEIYPLTFSYCPSDVPVTVTSKEQLPPAASDAPVNAIVLVAAVVVNVPVVHCVDRESATDRPTGKTSVKAIPVNGRL